jgi:hypothetical protein
MTDIDIKSSTRQFLTAADALEQTAAEFAAQHEAKLAALEAKPRTLADAAAEAIESGLTHNDPRMIEAGLELLKYADER